MMEKQKNLQNKNTEEETGQVLENPKKQYTATITYRFDGTIHTKDFLILGESKQDAIDNAIGELEGSFINKTDIISSSAIVVPK